MVLARGKSTYQKEGSFPDYSKAIFIVLDNLGQFLSMEKYSRTQVESMIGIDL